LYTQASLPENSIKKPRKQTNKAAKYYSSKPFRKIFRELHAITRKLAREEKEAFTKPSPRASALLCKP
jgi:DNA mismatch repair ATPase MutS